MFIDILSILQFLQILVKLKKYRQRRFRRHSRYSFVSMISVQPLIDIIRCIRRLRNVRNFTFPPNTIQNNTKAHKLIRLLYGYRSTMTNTDVWMNLTRNWGDFFWLTGDLPESLGLIVDGLQVMFPRRLGRCPTISFRNKVLLTMIWLRRYPTMNHLSMHFGITESYVCRIIHRILPLLHQYLVPKYIKWHSMNKWRSLAGNFPDWPNVVAILDCTCFRICRPAGQMESFYYRGDKKFNFMNWLVICDNELNIVYSRPGFLGHLHDATCYRHIRLPVLPAGLQIMADRGFPNVSPLLVPLPPRGVQVPPNMRKSFRSNRSAIERIFGNIKNAFVACGSIRYRSRRFSASLVCNIIAALYNRRKQMFELLRDQMN